MNPAPCIGDSGGWSLGIVEQSKGEDLVPRPPGKTMVWTVAWTVSHRLSGKTLSKLWEMMKDRETWRAGIHSAAKR